MVWAAPMAVITIKANLGRTAARTCAPASTRAVAQAATAPRPLLVLTEAPENRMDLSVWVGTGNHCNMIAAAGVLDKTVPKDYRGTRARVPRPKCSGS